MGKYEAASAAFFILLMMKVSFTNRKADCFQMYSSLENNPFSPNYREVTDEP